jgi:hypothetical protein
MDFLGVVIRIMTGAMVMLVCVYIIFTAIVLGIELYELVTCGFALFC